jgi:hypothetical protein
MLKQSVLPFNTVYLPKTSSIGWSEKHEMCARRKNTQAHRPEEKPVLSLPERLFFIHL